MTIKISEKGNSKVAIVESTDILIGNTQDALDLMATISHYYECNKMIIGQSSITESFFDLKTGVAGEILQKFTNYHFRIAVVGDFTQYSSNSLKDFIFESNKGHQVFFVDRENEALERLHNA